MKKSFLLLITTFLIILTGCLSTIPVENEPFQVVGDGVVEHIPSGMQFPPTLEDFVRGRINEYNTSGTDVSVAYDLPPRMKPIAITVYVYPSPIVDNLGSPAEVVTGAKNALARKEFQRTHEEILKAHQSAKVLEEESVRAFGEGGTLPGYFAKYSYPENFAGQVRPVESLLYIYPYVGDKWTIKYRITYLPETEAPSTVDWFMNNLTWTVR